MILRLIRWSLDNRFLVLAGALALAVAGEKSAQDALDAAAKKWDEITERNDRDSQITLYKAALGL